MWQRHSNLYLFNNNNNQHTPLICLQHMVLYKFVLTDWLTHWKCSYKQRASNFHSVVTDLMDCAFHTSDMSWQTSSSSSAFCTTHRKLLPKTFQQPSLQSAGSLQISAGIFAFSPACSTVTNIAFCALAGRQYWHPKYTAPALAKHCSRDLSGTKG